MSVETDVVVEQSAPTPAALADVLALSAGAAVTVAAAVATFVLMGVR